jgi:hypothetical protein
MSNPYRSPEHGRSGPALEWIDWLLLALLGCQLLAAAVFAVFVVLLVGLVLRPGYRYLLEPILFWLLLAGPVLYLVSVLGGVLLGALCDFFRPSGHRGPDH